MATEAGFITAMKGCKSGTAGMAAAAASAAARSRHSHTSIQRAPSRKAERHEPVLPTRPVLHGRAGGEEVGLGDGWGERELGDFEDGHVRAPGLTMTAP